MAQRTRRWRPVALLHARTHTHSSWESNRRQYYSKNRFVFRLSLVDRFLPASQKQNMCVKTFHRVHKRSCIQQLLQGVGGPACSVHGCSACLWEYRLSVRVATYCYIMCRGPDDLTSNVKSPSTLLIIFLSVSFNAFQDENDNLCILYFVIYLTFCSSNYFFFLISRGSSFMTPTLVISVCPNHLLYF